MSANIVETPMTYVGSGAARLSDVITCTNLVKLLILYCVKVVSPPIKARKLHPRTSRQSASKVCILDILTFLAISVYRDTAAVVTGSRGVPGRDKATSDIHGCDHLISPMSANIVETAMAVGSDGAELSNVITWKCKRRKIGRN
ncbi:Uncharacterized protein TCM_028139 [Theobroma cacao]|uniref:Uncharacterized protein n=1 Tax=Theobroma cacao TaxID=3641 RepID=A0A061GAL2_THECC|nr:Uncharacterized protein TCM_028139 [Theobroma cacao]